MGILLGTGILLNNHKYSYEFNLSLKSKDAIASIFLFFMAGLCEIGGGYLVWLWLRESFAWWIGASGGFILFLYAVVPTFQKAVFHRIYAAYGGVFVVMSIMWGWLIDGIPPDNYDIIGATIVVIGVLVIYYYPRKEEKIWKS